jgi:hypothetical protein
MGNKLKTQRAEQSRPGDHSWSAGLAGPRARPFTHPSYASQWMLACSSVLGLHLASEVSRQMPKWSKRGEFQMAEGKGWCGGAVQVPGQSLAFPMAFSLAFPPWFQFN